MEFRIVEKEKGKIKNVEIYSEFEFFDLVYKIINKNTKKITFWNFIKKDFNNFIFYVTNDFSKEFVARLKLNKNKTKKCKTKKI